MNSFWGNNNNQVNVDGHSAKFSSLDDFIRFEESPLLEYYPSAHAALQLGDIIHIKDGRGDDVSKSRPDQQIMMVFAMHQQGIMICLPFRHYTRRLEDRSLPKDHWKVSSYSSTSAPANLPGTLSIRLSSELRGEIQPYITIDLVDFWHIEGPDIRCMLVAHVPDTARNVLAATLKEYFNHTADKFSEPSHLRTPTIARDGPNYSFEPSAESYDPRASHLAYPRPPGPPQRTPNTLRVPRDSPAERRSGTIIPYNYNDQSPGLARRHRKNPNESHNKKRLSDQSGISNNRFSDDETEMIQLPVKKPRASAWNGAWYRRRQPNSFCCIIL